MKAEFYSPGFTPKEAWSFDTSRIKNNGALVCGIVAILISLVSLPIGLFMKLGQDILIDIFDHRSQHLFFVMFIISTVILLVSVIFGAISVCLFRKEPKVVTARVGLALSLISFVISTSALALNIISFIVW